MDEFINILSVFCSILFVIDHVEHWSIWTNTQLVLKYPHNSKNYVWSKKYLPKVYFMGLDRFTELLAKFNEESPLLWLPFDT